MPLPMADPTPNPLIEWDDDGLYSNDSVMDTDDALHEAGIPVDNLPVPTIGDQGNDHQDWESYYAIEDHAMEVLSAPQSAPQEAPANTGTLDSIFNVADESMADVTDNPWTTSP